MNRQTVQKQRLIVRKKKKIASISVKKLPSLPSFPVDYIVKSINIKTKVQTIEPTRALRYQFFLDVRDLQGCVVCKA